MFENNFIINIDIAKKNMQVAEKRLQRERKRYIRQLCKYIKSESKKGNKYVLTKTLREKIMSYEFMMELKEHFEKLGFTVTEKGNYSGFLTCWLEIRWDN